MRVVWCTLIPTIWKLTSACTTLRWQGRVANLDFPMIFLMYIWQDHVIYIHILETILPNTMKQHVPGGWVSTLPEYFPVA